MKMPTAKPTPLGSFTLGMRVRHSGLTEKSIHGLALVDCLIYIAVLAIILGLAFAAFFRVLDHSTELGRTARATVQALQAGEQWREDIRGARAILRTVPGGGAAELRISGAAGEIAYAFRDGVVLRRASAAAPWVEVLTEVNVSRFSEDRLRRVTAWRWEIELAARRENTKFRRVLTFQAVPAKAAPTLASGSRVPPSPVAACDQRTQESLHEIGSIQTLQ